MPLLDAIAANLLTPAVLFFVLGVLAAVLKTDLKLPESLYVTLTVYLLVAIGFKGGVSIAEAGIARVWWPAVVAIGLGTVIPLWCFPLLRAGGFSAVDAASIAAHYGSVSAVTFIAASNYLKQIGEPAEEYAAAFLAVMESPAIILGVLLGRMALRGEGRGDSLGKTIRGALHEALLGRSVFLLLGALLAGYLSGRRGYDATAGFFVTPFQGVLTLFLLEMGTVAGRRLGDLRKAHRGSGGDAPLAARRESHALAHRRARHHVPLQRHARDSALPRDGPLVDGRRAMTLHPMKLVTIVAEAWAREPLVRMLGECGAHGYTLIHVEGSGSQGDRVADLPESANIKLKVIVAPASAEKIMERLQTEFFPRYAMVAYESDIRVLRPEKF